MKVVGESGLGINVIATGETDHEFEPYINITKAILQSDSYKIWWKISIMFYL